HIDNMMQYGEDEEPKVSLASLSVVVSTSQETRSLRNPVLTGRCLGIWMKRTQTSNNLAMLTGDAPKRYASGCS
ncbi:UNVERIFIED_CONTAM: hypothetical protein NY603_41330, partial [Bacteroidetes bacterium 56_B9]